MEKGTTVYLGDKSGIFNGVYSQIELKNDNAYAVIVSNGQGSDASGRSFACVQGSVYTLKKDTVSMFNTETNETLVVPNHHTYSLEKYNVTITPVNEPYPYFEVFAWQENDLTVYDVVGNWFSSQESCE